MPKSQKQIQKKLKKLALLHTGGTIGMGLAQPPNNDRPLSPDDRFVKTLRKTVPELWRIADVEVLALSNKDSSQITPKDWIRLANTILKYNDDYDAFVVTHGTDTMAYTGSALSYLLPFPCKPVVLTGSQRPLQEVRNDARRNLINSVAVANQQRICEVSVFFDTVLLRANRAKKVHIEEYFTFNSPNFPKLAEEKLKTIYYPIAREALSRPQLEPVFDARIQVVKVFPGATVSLQPKARAVVIEAFGCGNLPLTESSVLELLTVCMRKKIPVVLTSQVLAGPLSPEIYEMGRKALELGAIPTKDMTFEATLVKCMMLIANKVSYADWPSGILSNWAGEIAPLARL